MEIFRDGLLFFYQCLFGSCKTEEEINTTLGDALTLEIHLNNFLSLFEHLDSQHDSIYLFMSDRKAREKSLPEFKVLSEIFVPFVWQRMTRAIRRGDVDTVAFFLFDKHCLIVTRFKIFISRFTNKLYGIV